MPHVEAILPDTQAGFRTSRGCRDNVCILAWTVEWLLENSHLAFITYIDFKAAFHILSHDFVIYSLMKFSVPEKYIRIVKGMYDKATVALRPQLRGGERLHSDRVSVNRGVLQGDILSPLCFITALHCIFSEHKTAYD